MTQTIEATVVNGMLVPRKRLDLEEGAEVILKIDLVDGTENDPLAAVIGICDDGPPISLAVRHDEFAHGTIPGGRTS